MHEKFRIPFSKQDKTRFDYWKRMEFTEEEWKLIYQHCAQKNIEFLCTPFSITACDFLMELGLKKFKVGSADLYNTILINRIASQEHDLIVSLGLFEEQDFNLLKSLSTKFKSVTYLYCISSYPTAPEKINLEFIEKMRKNGIENVGLSDHSGEIYPSIIAMYKDVKYIEVHFTWDKRVFGPDVTSSLTPEQLEIVISSRDFIQKMRSSENDNSDKNHISNVFQRSITARHKLIPGDIITIDSLETSKYNGHGILVSDIEKILDKVVTKDIEQYGLITYEDLQ
jgi:N-acetylneuraminate synthase